MVFLERDFLNGSQSYLRLFPEKHTDFIFTLFSEEFGFAGSLFILLLYSLIISRLNKLEISQEAFGKLYCYSFATAFFIYVAVNMGMVLVFTNSWCSTTDNVLWRIINDGNNVRHGIAMSCKIYKDTPVN